MSDRDKDYIKITPDDILTGKELAPSSNNVPISDKEIRDILKRFAPILGHAIENSDNFISVTPWKKLDDCVPITEEERGYWDGLFGVTERVNKLVEEGKLFVPDLTDDELKMLTDPTNKDIGQSVSTSIRPVDDKNGKFRINLDNPVWGPIQPFNPDGCKFMLKLNPHLGGRGGSSGHLYNAFIAEDLLVQDRHGRWAVSHTPGTGVASWMGGPIFGVEEISSVHVWFNTSIDKDKPNKWKVHYDYPDDLMMGIDIYHPEELDKLEVPDDPRQRFFFWQLRKFLSEPKLSGKRTIPFLGGGE